MAEHVGVARTTETSAGGMQEVGRHEQIVRIVTSHPLTARAAARLAAARNRDLHDLVLNGVA